MRHTFTFPEHIRNAVRRHVLTVTAMVDAGHFRQEPAYTSALLRRLVGVAYEDDDGLVSFRATNIDSIAPGAAEGWAGADFAITATIQQGDRRIEKAILAQTKLGTLDELSTRERKRLLDQVRNMRRLTRSPKVMVVPLIDGVREPRMLSGARVLAGETPRGLRLSDYVVARITTTFDGDTRPFFVEGVQDSSLAQLRVHAEMRGPRLVEPVPQRVKLLA